jgi:hypothetical protein
VAAPVGSGYGASAIDIPERGIYGPFFSKIGKCSNPNFRDAGLAVAQVDLWIIDYLAAERRIVPKDVIVVGLRPGYRRMTAKGITLSGLPFKPELIHARPALPQGLGRFFRLL